jgi:uroporphyrinogen decarboxylase
MDNYLENHLYMACKMDDYPLFFRNDAELLKKLEKKGWCSVDWKKNVVYDRWGVGVEMYSDGFFTCYNPLRGGDKKEVERFMPSYLKDSARYSSDEEAIKKYQAPDINKEGLLSWMERDLKKYSGEYLVWPSWYIGVFERAIALMGFEEFLTACILNPKMVEGLLDKITEYKIELAKRIVKLGFKVAHHGDDMGHQKGTLFSGTIFRKFFKPRIAKIWRIYKDAGLPIYMHSCGNITDFIPDLIEIGLDVLEPVQPCMDHKYLKKEYGKDIVFFGGIDTQDLLPFGTPAQVKQKAAETIRTLGRGGGHIIAPAQEIMKDVPIENVKALVETIRLEREKVLN